MIILSYINAVAIIIMVIKTVIATIMVMMGKVGWTLQAQRAMVLQSLDISAAHCDQR